MNDSCGCLRVSGGRLRSGGCLFSAGGCNGQGRVERNLHLGIVQTNQNSTDTTY